MQIELNCETCGSNRFSFFEGITDHSMVVCEDCGREMGTMTELKQMVAENVLKKCAEKTVGGRAE